MPLSKAFLLLILGIALEVSAGKWKKEKDFNSQKITQLLRQGFTLSCKDCSTLQYVLPAATAATEIACPDGQVCGPIDGAFNCIEADSPDASECSCGDGETVYIQDPYDNMKYYACLPDGSQVAQECTGNTFFTGEFPDPCADTPACTEAGFSKESCTRYYFCEDAAPVVPTIYTCEDGTVWDEINFACVNPCSLAPAAFTCDGQDDGVYPDTSDCATFHFCFLGTQITQQCTTGDNIYFDGSACGNVDTNCPATDECYEEYKDTCTDSTSAAPTISTADIDTNPTVTQTISTTETDTPTPTETTSTKTVSITTTTTLSTTGSSESSDTATPTETTATTASSTEESTTPIIIFNCDDATSPTYFPHNETCSKFYSCESDDEGGYEQKEYNCPGDLVFDPVTQYCNQLHLVPSCQE